MLVIVGGKIRIPRNWDADVVVMLDTPNKEVPLNIKSIGGKTIYNGEKLTGVIVNNEFNLCKEYQSKKEMRKCFGFISDDEITHDYVRVTFVDEINNGKTVWLERDDISNYYEHK